MADVERPLRPRARGTHRVRAAAAVATVPAPPPSTEDRILAAFLHLAARGGLEAATTRAIADEAGVNEVTIFRHFGDKATLALRAVRRFSPAAQLAARDPGIDPATPASAAAGLLACLRQMSANMTDRPELLLFGAGESARMPEVAEAVAAIPRAATAFLQRALDQAKPQLRARIDARTVALQWLGLLFQVHLQIERGVLPRMTPEEWDRVLVSAVRAVVRKGGGLK
jgi:AcrR family transcriptional regulator